MSKGLVHGNYTLTEQEVQNVINGATNFRDRVLIKALYYAGLRRQELQRLRIEDVDFDRKTIRVVESKGGKTRLVPIINAEFLSDLRHLVGRETSGAVFCGRGREKLSLTYINELVARIAERAGVKTPFPFGKVVNPHLFRHSIARHLKNKGYPVEFVQLFLGHASYKTTMDTYGRMGLNEMKEIVARRTGDLSLAGSDRRVPELMPPEGRE